METTITCGLCKTAPAEFSITYASGFEVSACAKCAN
jgi:hypothetical protein